MKYTLPQNVKAVLGIAGHKNSGKDMLYNQIVCLSRDNIMPRPIRFAFADLLKQEVANLRGVTVEYLNANKNIDPDIRRYLQEHGSEMRKVNPDYWIDALHKHIVNTMQAISHKIPHLIVITDVRHINESSYVRSIEGPEIRKVVRLYRKTVDSAIDAHESELNVNRIPYDYALDNNGSSTLLRNQIKFMLEDFKLIC
jgi:hypothetical protein